MMVSTTSEWLSSGWVVALLWSAFILEGSFSIGIAWLTIHVARRSNERAGKLLLAMDDPAGSHRRRRALVTGPLILCVATGLLALLIGFTSSQPLFSIPVAGLFGIIAFRHAAIMVARRMYPAYLEIHEHGLLYPANQPVSFVQWHDVRSWAVRQYRSRGEPEHRLIVQVPGHCQNLPIRADQLCELETLLQERLPVAERVPV